MKKYRLKQWYPSLQKKTIEGNIANWDYDEKAYTVIQNGDRIEILDKTEVEGNPDFWELIEEEKPDPLFITEDGVEYTHLSQQVWGVSEGFKKRTYWVSQIKGTKVKAFYHESNADEYIWKNKRVFSYEELIMFDSIKAEDDRTNELKRIAKERSEE